MFISRLHQFLTAPADKTARSRTIFWFCLSMTCAAVLGLLSLRVAFGTEYTVQDDARQHVFWMERFTNPALFPGDLIADYFQSVAPTGYTTLYKAVAAIGVDPFLFNKLLPFALILISTAYCFGACLQVLPVPTAGFIASLLLNQNLIMADDLNSATPRAFLYPFFLAFLYYLLRKSLLPCVVAIALLGLFYPQVMLIACGVLVLRLVDWQQGRPQLSRDRSDYIFSGVGLAVGAAMILLYMLEGSEFGPAITAAQARQMPEFWAGGRGSFFNNDPIAFWTFAGRSGILPHPQQLLKPPLILIGLLLPILLKLPQRFPLGRTDTSGVWMLTYTLVSSLFLFFAAHVLLFKLHHPSRYTQHSFRILLALTAGIALTILLDALLRWATARNTPSRAMIALGTSAVLAIVLAIYPGTIKLKDTPFGWLVPSYLLPGYTVGKAPEVYKFFAEQPQDSLIASLAGEGDNLPTHANRSTLAGREYGIPYHVGYYNQFKERAIDLIRAHYSPNIDEVRRFTEKYGVDFWLVERDAFTPDYLTSNSWIQQYQVVSVPAIATLEQGITPVVQQAMERCLSFGTEKLVVLQAECVVQTK